MKKIISLAVAVLLLVSTMTFPVLAAQTSHSVEMVTNNVVVSGSAMGSSSDVLLRVYAPGVAALSATDSDVIYYNVKTSDVEGNVNFEFSLAEYVGEFEYTIICTDASYMENGRFTYNPTRDNTIKSFLLSGTMASIVGDQITIVLPYGTNLTGLIATFDVQKDAFVYVGETLQKSGYTRNNFSTPVTYKVVADDGSEKVYTVTVGLTGIPTVSTGGGGGGGGGGGSMTSKPANPGQGNAPEPIVVSLFDDVNGEYWAYDYIAYLVEKDVVSGYDGNVFKPENDITRAEFVKLIVNAFDVVPGEKEVSFGDVSGSDWFSYYVGIASSNGLVAGDDSGYFNPNAPITREDMAVIMKRVADYAKISLGASVEATDFADNSSISDYATAAIKTLNTAGIISGYPDGTIRPDANAARAEACAMIVKVLNK